jgi:3-methyladenine DNA glycosylase AlkD
VEQWIREGRFHNWAEIDALAPGVVTPLIERFPDLVPRVMGWTSSRNQWMRRAAVVSLVLPARRGEKLDVAYRVVRGLLDDREDLMHKACGWLLREAGKTDMARLERFLLQYGSSMPRTSVRYAIERFPERKRKQLLMETKTAASSR